jgi:hypothetical protein
MKYRATIAAWFSNFFEKAFVKRVKRRAEPLAINLLLMEGTGWSSGTRA